MTTASEKLQTFATKIPANIFALAAILLWGTLAALGVRLAAMPPFLLVGCTLLIAAVLSLPTWRDWRVAPSVLGLGVYGLFGYHFFLFVGLREAPPVQANIVNYLWPLLIVLLSPLFLPGVHTSPRHLLAGLMGFAGVVLIIMGGASFAAIEASHLLGFGAVAIAAFIWASYSLLSKRLASAGLRFPTGAIGLFCLVSGALAMLCHFLLEPAYQMSSADLPCLLALGIGPMGAAFFLWDAALKRGDARVIGTLSYLTPLISTLLLMLSGSGKFGLNTLVAMVLIIGGALVGSRKN